MTNRHSEGGSGIGGIAGGWIAATAGYAATFGVAGATVLVIGALGATG